MSKDVLLFTDSYEDARLEIEGQGGRVTHKFTNSVLVAILPDELDPATLKNARPDQPPNIDHDSRLMADAWRAGQTKKMKGTDETEGLSWDAPGYEPPGSALGLLDHVAERRGTSAERPSELDQKDDLPIFMNSIAVGLLAVSGKDDLAIHHDEYLKIMSEVHLGLNFLAKLKPSANITFIYDWHPIDVDAKPCDTAACVNTQDTHCIDPWLEPAMKKIGYPKDYWLSVGEYVEKLKKRENAQHAFAAFITKYPLCYYATAIGVSIIFMNYQNDTWGPDNIHRVFAHEACHMFDAHDEYESSWSGCDSKTGYLKVPNYNSVKCPNAVVPCLMKDNTLEVCEYTQWQMGWNNVLLANQSVGPSGGLGGESFEETSLPAGARISKVKVYHAERIIGVGVSYELNGSTVNLPVFGGTGGTLSELFLDKDEYLTDIFGWYAGQVDSLVVKTNKRTSPSYGGPGGKAFYRYSVPPNLQFAGFSGRCAGEIDALGLILTRRSEARTDSFVSMGPSGGPGGQDFQDDPIPPEARITRLTVRHAGRIDAIGLSYELNGRIYDMPMHGGAGGNLSEFRLDDDEYLVGISGRYGGGVDSLIIQTNKRFSTRYGGSGGTSIYSYTLSPNLEIVGLLGRSGGEIDAIGAVFRQRTWA